MILDIIINAIGLDVIDKSLVNLIDHMHQWPEKNLLNEIQNWAKMIGLCIALGVGSFECWMMMLGKRGMDVMKILRIVIISMCISASGWIYEEAKIPGESLTMAAKEMAENEHSMVADLEKQIAAKQKEYYDSLRSYVYKNKAQEVGDRNLIESAGDVVKDIPVLGTYIKNVEYRLKSELVVWETRLSEMISVVIRYLGEIIFQMAYYGLLLAQAIFMHLLAAFCPIAFAISLAPPYRNAWSQWLSKYISLSLWGFVIYMILYYVYYIMQYTLMEDFEMFNNLLVSNDSYTFEKIHGLGMESLGTTCMYIVGLLVGVFVLKFVPEVSSWLVPGGISSGIGTPAMGVPTGMATSIGNSASSQIGKAIK